MTDIPLHTRVHTHTRLFVSPEPRRIYFPSKSVPFVMSHMGAQASPSSPSLPARRPETQVQGYLVLPAVPC